MQAADMNPMGNITRLYRSVTRLYSTLPYEMSKSGAALPAWHYFLEVTRRCNLRCKMCQYIEWYNNTSAKEQKEGELTTDEWLNVVDQTGPLSLITFTGGEVFVRRDFPQILEHAASKRRVHFISNATMLTDEKAKMCAELSANRLGGRGLNFVGTSIDGTRDIHDEVRVQKGSFDKSIEGVKMLAQYRDELGKKCPLVHINTVILEDNLECLPEMPQVAADAGASVLNLLTEMRSLDDYERVGKIDPGSYDKSDITMRIIDRDRLDKALKATKREADRLGVELRLPRMPYDEVLKHYDGGYDMRHFECRAVWVNLYVDSKGGVYPCFIQQVGNVREKTLKEIWNGPELREFRRRRRSGGFALCRGCCEMEHSERAVARADAEDARSGTNGESQKEVAGAARSADASTSAN